MSKFLISQRWENFSILGLWIFGWFKDSVALGHEVFFRFIGPKLNEEIHLFFSLVED